MASDSSDSEVSSLVSQKKGIRKYQSITEEGEKSSSSEVSFIEPSRCQRYLDIIYPAGFTKELKEMWVITWPIVLTQISQMIIGPISLIFCGHLGDPIQLDGAALAISMINATAISVGQGLGTACDTFFSQSFGGTNKKQVGVYLQRSLLIFPLVFMCVLPLSLNMEAILLLFGQDPEVSRLAGVYMLYFIPGAFSFFMYMCLAKYIQNQNIVLPNVAIGFTANAVNALLHYLFLYQFGYGTAGSAVAQTIAYFLMFVMTLGYIYFSKCYVDTWGGWTSECLQEWGKFAKLAIPGMLMICLEWWGFEISVFLTGILGTTELGAQAVLLQLDSIWFQIPMGIQIACSIRVGQYLGSGSPEGAKTAANLALTVVFFISILVVILFLSLRYQLPYIFTNVVDIAELTGQLLPIVALYIFFDGIATACKGVLYGTGRQIYGAVILFISFYVLGLPIGIPLMFLTPLRTAGYWWALGANLILQALVLYIMVVKTNWQDEYKKAKDIAGIIGEELDDESEDEYIPVKERKRPHSVPRVRRASSQRLLSATLSPSEAATLMEPVERLRFGPLMLWRLLAVFIALLIFTAGVLCKVYYVIPEYQPDTGNSTTNFTTAIPTTLFDVSTAIPTTLFDVSTAIPTTLFNSTTAGFNVTV